MVDMSNMAFDELSGSVRSITKPKETGGLNFRKISDGIHPPYAETYIRSQRPDAWDLNYNTYEANWRRYQNESPTNLLSYLEFCRKQLGVIWTGYHWEPAQQQKVESMPIEDADTQRRREVNERYNIYRGIWRQYQADDPHGTPAYARFCRDTLNIDWNGSHWVPLSSSGTRIQEHTMKSSRYLAHEDDYRAYRREMSDKGVSYNGSYEHFMGDVMRKVWSGESWFQHGEPKWTRGTTSDDESDTAVKVRPKAADLGLTANSIRVNVPDLLARLDSVENPSEAVTSLMMYLQIQSKTEIDLPVEKILSLDIDLTTMRPLSEAMDTRPKPAAEQLSLLVGDGGVEGRE